jgi:uncharacterized protein
MMVNYRGLFAGKLLLFSGLLIVTVGCTQPKPPLISGVTPIETQVASPKLKQVLQAAIEQTKYTRGYDPAYVAIAYPGGDVPRESGVCTDVVIRAFRAIGMDL